MRRWAVASIVFVAIGFILLTIFVLGTVIMDEMYDLMSTTGPTMMTPSDYVSWDTNVAILRDVFAYCSVFFFIMAAVAYIMDSVREEHEIY
jgi:hypothetical protein